MCSILFYLLISWFFFFSSRGDFVWNRFSIPFAWCGKVPPLPLPSLGLNLSDSSDLHRQHTIKQIILYFFSAFCNIISVAVFARNYKDFFQHAENAKFHFSFVFCVLSIVLAGVAGMSMIIEVFKRSSYSPIWGQGIELWAVTFENRILK